MRELVLKKLSILKKLIASMNSDAVSLINTTALIEIKLRKEKLSVKEYSEIEGELNLLIIKYSEDYKI